MRIIQKCTYNKAWHVILNIHLKVITLLGSPIPGGISGLLLPVVLKTQGYIGFNQGVHIECPKKQVARRLL